MRVLWFFTLQTQRKGGVGGEQDGDRERFPVLWGVALTLPLLSMSHWITSSLSILPPHTPPSLLLFSPSLPFSPPSCEKSSGLPAPEAAGPAPPPPPPHHAALLRQPPDWPRRGCVSPHGGRERERGGKKEEEQQILIHLMAPIFSRRWSEVECQAWVGLRIQQHTKCGHTNSSMRGPMFASLMSRAPFISAHIDYKQSTVSGVQPQTNLLAGWVSSTSINPCHIYCASSDMPQK